MLKSAFRKYSKTAAIQATGHIGENPLFLVHYLIRTLRVVLLLSIWRVAMAGRGVVSGMDLGTLLTYTLVAEVFAEPLAARTALPHELHDGRYAVRFLRPMRVFDQYFAESLGSWFVGLCLFSAPLVLIAPLLGVNPLPRSAALGLWFIPSLALAVAVGFALDAIFCALVIMVEYGEYSVNQLRSALTLLLTGAVLPLAVYPWKMGEIFGWLPFACQASAPLRIYTGTGDPIRLIAVQAAWALLLWPSARLLWKKQRERLVTYGG